MLAPRGVAAHLCSGAPECSSSLPFVILLRGIHVRYGDGGSIVGAWWGQWLHIMRRYIIVAGHLDHRQPVVKLLWLDLVPSHHRVSISGMWRLRVQVPLQLPLEIANLQVLLLQLQLILGSQVTVLLIQLLHFMLHIFDCLLCLHLFELEFLVFLSQFLALSLMVAQFLLQVCHLLLVLASRDQS